MEDKEWDEPVEKEPRHEVQEPTTYELADQHYKEEQKIAYEKK